MDRLPFSPLINSTSKAQFRVKALQFGDGYEQRAQDGINTDLRTYNVEFVGSREYVDQVQEFFEKQKGVKSFLWTAPDRKDERKYVSQGFNISFLGKRGARLKVELREVVI